VAGLSAVAVRVEGTAVPDGAVLTGAFTVTGTFATGARGSLIESGETSSAAREFVANAHDATARTSASPLPRIPTYRCPITSLPADVGATARFA
jgi:hypothetical protein